MALDICMRFGARKYRNPGAFSEYELYMFPDGHKRECCSSSNSHAVHVDTTGDFALVFARHDQDDDESSFFRLGATLFRKLPEAQRKLREGGPTVAACFRTDMQRLYKAAVSAGRNRKYPWERRVSDTICF